MAIAKRASILALLFICTIALACYYADAKKPSKAPASKAPVSKAPASKAPVSKAPASKAPVSKAPASKAPASKAPVSKAPVSKAPASKAPASKAPAIKAPASKAPAIKAPAGKKPVVGGPDIYHGKENMNHDALLPGEKVVNVKDFGAVADGVSDSTQAFMDAWRATCSSTQQSRLLVPAGRFLIASMFFNGPCGSPNPVTIQVVGHVLASKDISEYENGQWLFFQDHPKGIKIIGSGTFDGQGKESWTVADNCDRRRETCVLMPSSLYFSRVTNAVVQGITSLNPKGFHIFVTYCANFRLQNLKLIAPDLSPNTDGIHVSNSNNVIMTKNIIETGDDCISLIQGSTNITITNLKCGPGHGISIGSLGKVADESEVRGVHVSNCTLVGTTNGLRIKAWPGDKFPNSASDIVYKDILMVDVKNPIIIDEEYQCTPNKCQKKPSLVKINNVQISNVKGTTISQVAVDLRCSRSFPCKNVSFQNVDLRLRNNLPTTSRCSSVKPIYGGMSMPPPCLMS